MEDLCYGCIDFDTCPIKRENIKGQSWLSDCPCSICLLKSMCHDQCDDFSHHFGRIFGLENTEK